MDPQRWEEIERLYHLAREREAGEREKLLEEMCGSDEALRREVESLLARPPESQDFLEAPALEVAAQVLARDKLNAPPTDIVGRTIAHYRVLEKIGKGGMGVVYKARDLHLGRFVALKVLPPEQVADPERKRRFVQEAKAASALNHPNIVHVYDIDQSEGTDYIAMEYVDGKTLDQRIGHRGLHLNDALRYAVQIADALAKAHSAGIIHRDLKPTNIMVNKDAVVKVLDFGLAKLTEQIQEDETASTATVDSEGRPITEEGVIVGTVSYMSPEQAEGKKVDARSDIFSFGSVLYEMVTGQKAFQGTSKMSTLSAILHDEPKPASGISPAIPSDLEKLINRCLRKDPTKRLQHMDDVKVALDELKEESDSRRLQATAAKAKPRHRLIWTLGVLAVLAIAAAGIWVVRSRVGTQEIPLTTVPLTSYPGFERGASFSPDGNQVAFASSGEQEDNWDIYIKLIGSEPPMRLTSNKADDRWPAWSPDGRQIAFCRDLGGGKRAVVLISPLGGPERILTEFHFSDLQVSGPFLSWSPDGRALAVVEQADRETSPNLVLHLMDTGAKYPLTKTTKTYPTDSCPAFSSDGRTLAFCRLSAWENGDLYLLDLSRDLKPVGEPRRLTFHNLSASGAAWVSNQSALVYSAGGSLWRISASGSDQPQKLVYIGQDAYSPVYSHRASRLAFTHLTSDDNIWRIELSSPQGKAGPPAKFISSTRNDWSPQYSPDGKKIAFASQRSGSWEIWVCDADGSNAIQLTHLGKEYFTADARWSPDGSRLTFNSSAEGHVEVYVINAGGGDPQRLTSSSGSGDPSWSRDGRWIYFSSLEGLVQKVPVDGGPVVLVNRNPPGCFPVESPDGKFIYFIGVGTDYLFRVPVEGGEAKQILGPLVRWGIGHALVDDGIYFIPMPDSAREHTIRFFTLATGETKTIADLGKHLFCWSLSVSPDRRWALYTQRDQSGSDLMLVENFR